MHDSALPGQAASSPGPLVLVPNTLDLGAPAVDLQALLPLAVIQRAASLAHWVAEDARSARAFLKRVQAVVPLAQPLQATDIRELPRPRKGSGRRGAHQHLAGIAGPGLARERSGADLRGRPSGSRGPRGRPGGRAAHAAGLRVEVLPGASSLLLAVAASGLNGQSFAFVGYLPQEQAARSQRLRETRRLLAPHGTDTARDRDALPQRRDCWLRCLAGLAPATRLSVSCGLTMPEGWSRTDSVAGWRKSPRQMPDTLRRCSPSWAEAA